MDVGCASPNAYKLLVQNGFLRMEEPIRNIDNIRIALLQTKSCRKILKEHSYIGGGKLKGPKFSAVLEIECLRIARVSGGFDSLSMILSQRAPGHTFRSAHAK